MSESSVKRPLGVCERSVRSVKGILTPRDLCPFGGQGGAEPGIWGEGHGSREEPAGAAVKNPSGYGDRNGRMVGVRAGEALPGPGPAVVCSGSDGRV